MLLDAFGEAIGGAIGETVGLVLVLSALLAACLLATAALGIAYGLRASTDATVVGAVAGVVGGAVGAGVVGTDGPLFLGVAVVAAAIGFLAATSARGSVRRPPFQSRTYGLVVGAVAVLAVVVGLAFWAYLLGLETDVVGVLRDDPGDALLLLAFTLTPIVGGGFVLRDVLRRGPGAV